MAAVNSDENACEKTFEQNWVIKKLASVLKCESLSKSTKTEIQCIVGNINLSTFIVSTTLYNDNTCLGLCWQLTHKHDWFDNVQAVLDVKFPKTGRHYEKEENAVLGETMDFHTGLWSFPNASDFSALTNAEGSLEIQLQLTLTISTDIICYIKTENLFQETSKNEFGKRLTALLDDNVHSDVKIITKDKIELLAHKAILSARCPLFATMFNSDFPENSTGRVNIDDISAKTMKIILKYWYTGKLAPSWKDTDTVVEFTYAAEKYQMTEVLGMLDGLLGYDFKKETTDGELLQLLKMVNKLSLKNAEERVLKLIVNKVRQANGGAELLDLFPFATDKLGKEAFDISQILNFFEEILSDKNNDVASFDVKLMASSCKLGKANLETKLVQRIKDTVIKMTSADELFALFDMQYEINDDDSKEICLLERIRN